MNVLITGARAPIAADIAHAFVLQGHRVYTSDSLSHPVGRYVPGIAGYLRLPAPRANGMIFGAELAQAIFERDIELVIPTSEEVFWLAHVKAAHGEHWPATCRLFTSSAQVLDLLHHKGSFAQMANTLGIGAGTFHGVATPEQMERFLDEHDPAGFVFKRMYSRFATDVLISPSVQDVRALTLDESNPWLAQPRVHGEEVCLYNIAHEGELLLHTAYRPRWRAGKGASVYFEPVQDASLMELSRKVVAATSFTGQISFDVIQGARGPVAIECNPRGTSGVHLAAQQPYQLVHAFNGKPAGVSNPEPRMLALPLLMYHPQLLLSKEGRAGWKSGKDAMREAGVPLRGQVMATAELLWKAAKARTSPQAVSTVDIEWNGTAR